MVIANSNSNTTLVSLNGEGKNIHVANDENIVLDGESGLLKYVEASASQRASLSSNSRSLCCVYGGIPTELMISVDDHSSSSSASEHVPLYLPLAKKQTCEGQNYGLDIDEYISRTYYDIDNTESKPYNCLDHPHPASNMLRGAQKLKESRTKLLTSKRREISEQRLLYVAQGERANATSEHYDVVMSDKATTCHVVAFRSSMEGASNTDCVGSDLPLTSLTHLDGTQYEQCVRDMVQEHTDYHHRAYKSKRKRENFEEKKCDESGESFEARSCSSQDNIIIDIHIVGGFNDIDSSSSDITEWLMRLLARIAQEFKDKKVGVRMVIKTLVVSSSNNEVDAHNNDSPMGRGLGIDLQTGDVFLTDNQVNNNGPVSILRSVRLWSRSHLQPHKLTAIHTISLVEDLWASFGVDANDKIRKEYSLFWVQPFRLRSVMDVDSLLVLPDELLLQYTSTSPDVEEAGFCDNVRDSMMFLKQHCDIMKEDGRSYFGERFDRPMVFAMHCTNSNSGSDKEWKKIQV